MKNCFLIMVFLLTFKIFGQPEKREMSFGLQAGINRSSLRTSGNTDFFEDTKGRSNYNITVSGSYPLSKNWAIKSKLILDNKGFNDGTSLIFGDITTEADYQLTYLGVPVLLDWYFGKENPHYIGVGPYVGILLKAKNRFDENSVVKHNFKNADFGLHLNAGTTKKLSERFKLAMELGSTIGLNRINRADSQILFGGQGAIYKNMVLYFNLGVIFNNSE